MSCYVILYCGMLYCITLYYISMECVVYVILYCIVVCYIVLHYIILVGTCTHTQTHIQSVTFCHNVRDWRQKEYWVACA